MTSIDDGRVCFLKFFVYEKSINPLPPNDILLDFRFEIRFVFEKCLLLNQQKTESNSLTIYG